MAVLETIRHRARLADYFDGEAMAPAQSGAELVAGLFVAEVEFSPTRRRGHAGALPEFARRLFGGEAREIEVKGGPRGFQPTLPNQSIALRMVERRSGADSGRRTLRGEGSKVRAVGTSPVFAACWTAEPDDGLDGEVDAVEIAMARTLPRPEAAY